MSSSTLSAAITALTLCLLPTGCLPSAWAAPPERTGKASDWMLPVAQLDADPAIPKLEDVVGHRWADDICSHDQIEKYLRALVQAAPARARLVQYGASYEGRALYYLVVSSARHMSQLEQRQKENLRLADSGRTTPEEAQAIIRTAPALVWLASGIHGNEASSPDATLLIAYHLLADRRPATRKWLDEVIVLIDPLQNPDGHARFINAYRESRGIFAQSHPWASEHTERWPGGRSNHYLFDMNRDWFLHSQLETQHKVAAYLDWQPQIYVDAHEMGRNSTYYFAPPTDPINPFLLSRQRDWFYRLGRHQAQHFDRYGFGYTTREIFDAFYPGYGSEWPTLQGGIGVLWEQAGSRGLVIDRDDETKLHFHDGVRHHYISGLATVDLAARQRVKLLEDFHNARQRGIQLGAEGDVRHFFLVPFQRPARTARLARVLKQNGIEVRRLQSALTVRCRDTRDATRTERNVPAGSYHVPVAQGSARLIRALLDRRVEMDEEFVKRQLSRNTLRLPDEIYDVTAWSLPLAFDVTCLATAQAAEIDSQPWDGKPSVRNPETTKAQVAYLVPGSDAALQALAGWLQAGYRVHVADRPLKLDQRRFDRGTLILKVHENGDPLHQVVRDAQRSFDLEVHAANTGFVSEGAHFGGPYVRWVRPPKTLLLVDRPTSYSVGHTWHLFDQQLHYPVTRVAARNLPRVALDAFNVLIVPHGRYEDDPALAASQVDRLKQWVRQGGTLILLKGATAWACSEEVGLVASSVVRRKVPADEQPKPESQAADESEEKPLTESPDSVPGAFLRANVFDQHWLTYSYGTTLDVCFSGNLILSPVSPSQGRNLVSFTTQDSLVTSGFCWPQTQELLAGKTYLVYQASGSGHVIAFADDPNFRAMYPGLQRLFINAVLFGPGH